MYAIIKLFAVLLTSSLILVACTDDKPAEKASESMTKEISEADAAAKKLQEEAEAAKAKLEEAGAIVDVK